MTLLRWSVLKGTVAGVLAAAVLLAVACGGETKVVAPTPEATTAPAVTPASITTAVATVAATPRPGPPATLAPRPTETATPTPRPAPTPTGTGFGREVLELWRTWQQKTELSLPFDGVAYVSQGWNGADPTHYGKWRYALDFIRLDSRGRSHTGRGDRVEDYYIWGARVLAPADGTVTALDNSFPDNPPGHPAEGKDLSGNHIVIDHGNGEYSEFSHLQRDSLMVTVGQPVARGQPIALVGSSGFSYEPHAHFQMQDSPDIQATTLPAVFARYYQVVRSTTSLRTNTAPLDGDYVSSQRP